MRSSALLAAVLLTSTLVREADAQVSLMQNAGFAELSVTHVTPGGDDFTRTDSKVEPGMGFDLVGVVRIRPRILLALGIQNTFHETDYSDDKLRSMQVFAEPRYEVLRTDRMHAYLAVRAGLYTHSQEISLTDDLNVTVTGDMTQTGSGYGLGAGAGYVVAGQLLLSASAIWQAISLGEIQFRGSPVGESSIDGSGLTLRLGASWSFVRGN